MPEPECTKGLVCWLLHFGKEWKDLIPLIGAGIVALTAACVAFWATWRLNTAMKRTEFFLKFTERFHNILQAKHQLELRADQRDVETGLPTLGDEQRTKEAQEIYRQFFGLMFDEFFSYKKGFLDRAAFVEWMRWRQFDYSLGPHDEPNFSIAGISYRDGWGRYCGHRMVHPEFQQFLQGIHLIPDNADIERTINAHVLSYANPSQRILGKISDLASEYRIVLCFFAILLVFVGWCWLVA